MTKIFLSHSSKDKESYVRIVANKLIKELGEDKVILDEITFQEGRKTAEEIENSLEITDIFVFFISKDSLKSDWVKSELFKAEELWKTEKLNQICPIIIDSDIKYDDPDIPKWLQDNYNLQYISRPVKAARIIQQRMIELTFERHPRLQERKQIFVGRNDLISDFEERIDDYEKANPICVVASGIMSVGRRTLLAHCVYKCNIKKGSYTFPMISLNYLESIEDFIVKLYDLGLTEDIDLKNLACMEMDTKLETARSIVRNLQKQSEIILIEDNGAIVTHESKLVNWFKNLIDDESIQDKLTLLIVSKFRLVNYGDGVSYAVKEKIYRLEVGELQKKERNGLLHRYLEFENQELDVEDFRWISELLAGFPEQVFFAVSLLKERGMQYTKDHSSDIIDFNNKKASLVLRDIEADEEKSSFLALLSKFDYIGISFINEIISSEVRYLRYLDEFISKAICEYVGVSKEYIRVNETIKNYVIRNTAWTINKEHNENLEKSLESFLMNLKMDEYDIPEYLFSLKEALIQGKTIDSGRIVPSLYLKSMTELYNKGKNKEVVDFADKALENEAYIDESILFEIRYLLCSALARQRDKRFIDEVRKIEGASRDFLYGFYYRQMGRFDRALETIEKCLEENKSFSKAKRELVQIYIGLQEFQKAKDLAKENYLNYPDNPYHIHAYCTCLMKSEKSEDNRETIQILIAELDAIKSDLAKEMTLRSKAQYEAIYNGNEELSLAYINQAIEFNPNLQYARMVKFDICSRFDLIADMEEIIQYFEKKDPKRYQSNLICFKSILMAKKGDIDGAINYFKTSIKDYTDEAKEKFVNRLVKKEYY